MGATFAGDSPHFAIRCRRIDENTTVVVPSGSLDLATAPKLKWTLVDLLEAGGSRFVVDLSNVSFMDSTALGVLIGFKRNLPPNRLIVIAAPSPGVVALLAITGLERAFELFPSCEAAITFVQQVPAPSRDHGHDGAGRGDLGPPEGGCGDLGPPEGDVLVEPADESPETASADASLTADAAMLLGIAATAMPFARSTGAQAERWLRILSRHGDAGGVLASLGIGDDRLEPFTEPADEHGQRLAQAFPGDPVATVTRCAQLVAHRLGASRIRPSDLLRAVITIYGSQFEHALMRRGVETKDVLERLGELPPGDR